MFYITILNFSSSVSVQCALQFGGLWSPCPGDPGQTSQHHNCKNTRAGVVHGCGVTQKAGLRPAAGYPSPHCISSTSPDRMASQSSSYSRSYSASYSSSAGHSFSYSNTSRWYPTALGVSTTSYDTPSYIVSLVQILYAKI